MCDAINGGREPNAPGLAPACGFEMRGDVVFGFGGDGLGSGWLRSLAEQVGGAGQRMAGGGDLAGLAAKQKGVDRACRHQIAGGVVKGLHGKGRWFWRIGLFHAEIGDAQLICTKLSKPRRLAHGPVQP